MRPDMKKFTKYLSHGKRKALIVLLSLGTIGGFACGVANMYHHKQNRHSEFKQTVTNICADAIRQAQSK
jgi:hypothetical protein